MIYPGPKLVIIPRVTLRQNPEAPGHRAGVDPREVPGSAGMKMTPW